jgi:hypothetical protein
MCLAIPGEWQTLGERRRAQETKTIPSALLKQLRGSAIAGWVLPQECFVSAFAQTRARSFELLSRERFAQTTVDDSLPGALDNASSH